MMLQNWAKDELIMYTMKLRYPDVLHWLFLLWSAKMFPMKEGL